MRSLASMLLVVVGCLLLATPALPGGLLMIGGGVWMFTRVSSASQERFTACLMLLGALGALAVGLQWAWERLGQ